MIAEHTVDPFEPRRPLLMAVVAASFWIIILSLPMWTGKFLGGPASDQLASGVALRMWAAAQWTALGHVPLWNPEIMGGLPFVGAMHGDIFYPTAWLRLIIPTPTAMNIGFVVHYVLAGVFAYGLLRRLKLSWTASVVGGLAYEMSGVILSYVQPGHDGKLYVTALFPLALLALLLALRDRRLEGYGLLALTVGLAVLSPHPQMLYYMLVAGGIFALYLTFDAEIATGPLGARAWRLGGALGAVALGLGIGAIQVWPFLAYTPFSPRAEVYRGWEGATSYAIPWNHLPEFLLQGFMGDWRTYWGTNPLKLHSEYLGLPVLALALVGMGDRARRRQVLWLGGIGLLFLLIALGSATPFYRVWYEVMPYMKQVRAAGMALYVVALVLAVYAAMGVDRWREGRAGGALPKLWGVGAAVLGGLAVFGAFGILAEGLATSPQHAAAARASAGAIRAGALASAVALGALAVVTWGWQSRRLAPAPAVLLLLLTVSGDLWWNGRRFWSWTDLSATLYAPDAITEYLRGQPRPLRVLNLTETTLEVYPSNVLMGFDIPQLLGHHGNQLQRFNEVVGGASQWSYVLASRRLWDIYAIGYVILPAGFDPDRAWPDFTQHFAAELRDVPTSAGVRADLWGRRVDVSWAKVVPVAAVLPDDRAVPLVADPRSLLGLDQVVLVEPNPPVPVDSLTAIPAPLAITAFVDGWEPGHMHVQIDPAPTERVWVLVAENWYPDWRATVDGRETPVVRADVALLAVPVPAGAREVELRFESADYRAGKRVTLASLVVVLLALALPPILRRRRG